MKPKREFILYITGLPSDLPSNASTYNLFSLFCVSLWVLLVQYFIFFWGGAGAEGGHSVQDKCLVDWLFGWLLGWPGCVSGRNRHIAPYSFLQLT